MRSRIPSYNVSVHCMEGFLYGRKERSNAQPPSGTERAWIDLRGNSLHVCRLELEKGEAEIEGKVDSLIYTQGRKEKKKGSLLKRLFQ